MRSSNTHSDSTWVTRIIKQRNITRNGAEYLKIYVGNFPDVYADKDQALGLKSIQDKDDAYSYAHWLHKKFNTENIIDDIV